MSASPILAVVELYREIVGLVPSTITGDISDIYFWPPTMQNLSSATGYVNEVRLVEGTEKEVTLAEVIDVDC